MFVQILRWKALWLPAMVHKLTYRRHGMTAFMSWHARTTMLFDPVVLDVMSRTFRRNVLISRYIWAPFPGKRS